MSEALPFSGSFQTSRSREVATPAIEVSHDQNKNIWFQFKDRPKQDSILSGQTVNTGVITEAGRAFLPPERRRSLMERAADNSLPKSLRELGRGSEGQVKIVYDSPNRVASALGIRGGEAAIKTLISPIDKPLLPWETVQLFDAIRPAFDANGLNLMRPLGAVNNELYMPLIRGKTVEGYLRSIGNPELSGALRRALEERTLPLHHAVHEQLNSALESKGLTRTKAGDQLNDNDADTYPDTFHKGHTVRALVDLHPGQAAHTYDLTRRYRNWMISDADIKILEQAGSMQQAKDTFIQAAVAVDPFLVYSRNMHASPLERIR